MNLNVAVASGLVTVGRDRRQDGEPTVNTDCGIQNEKGESARGKAGPPDER
jgi:hypothetical protein